MSLLEREMHGHWYIWKKIKVEKRKKHVKWCENALWAL